MGDKSDAGFGDALGFGGRERGSWRGRFDMSCRRGGEGSCCRVVGL